MPSLGFGIHVDPSGFFAHLGELHVLGDELFGTFRTVAGDGHAFVHKEGGDGHFATVDQDVTVADDLASFSAGLSKTQVVDHVVQATLEQGEQVLTGVAL